VLVAIKKYDILILSRRDVPDATHDSNISYHKTDYSSVEELEGILQGVKVVLSFIAPYMDQEDAFNVQKNIIDASLKAGVKRFAPSEWASYVSFLFLPMILPPSPFSFLLSVIDSLTCAVRRSSTSPGIPTKRSHASTSMS
jgi:hypothetical protein